MNVWRADLSNPDRENHLTAVRIGLALMVAVAHAWVVPFGELGSSWRAEATMTAAGYGVNGFFLVSGFLIAKSLEQRPDLIAYAAARSLRIFPGLIALVVIALILIGPAFTRLPLDRYVASGQTWAFAPNVLLFIKANAGLPETFATGLESFSAPLWTLRYEVLAYIGAGLAFALGIYSGRVALTVIFTASALAYIAVGLPVFDRLPAIVDDGARFAVCFALGSAAYAWRADLRLTPAIGAGLILLSVPSFLLPFTDADPTWLARAAEIGGAIGLGGLIGLVAYPPRTSSAIARLPDVSYGLYIWHWPVQQSLATLWLAGGERVGSAPILAPLLLLALSAPITLALAYASWRLVEKPALRAKGPATRAIKRLIPRRNATPAA